MLCYVDSPDGSDWPWSGRDRALQKIMNTYGPRQSGVHDIADNGPAEISKKDVLRQTGISYGQFYRWKRMGLIPEAWFSRRSTYTGQETFLPRRKVLERIRQIQSLKDEKSLEQLAEMFSPDAAGKTYRPDDVRRMTWISSRARELLPERGDNSDLRFVDVVCLAAIQRLLDDGRLADEQVRLAASTLTARLEQLGHEGGERYLAVVAQGGSSLAMLYTGTCLFDEATQVVASVNLDELVDQVKIRLRDVLE